MSERVSDHRVSDHRVSDHRASDRRASDGRAGDGRAGDGTSDRASAAPVPPGYAPAARLGALADGALLGVTVGGRGLCLARAGGEVTALEDSCTHAAFPLSAGDLLPDGSVQCAWHGARFDRRTGAVRAGPACDPVASHPVLVVDDVVYVRVGS